MGVVEKMYKNPSGLASTYPSSNCILQSFNPHTTIHSHSFFTLAMFSKLALIVTSACALAAVAAPTPGGGSSSCNNSDQSLQCCNSTQNASDISGLLTLLGIEGATGLVGVKCTSVVGGSSWWVVRSTIRFWNSNASSTALNKPFAAAITNSVRKIPLINFKFVEIC